MIIAVRQVKQRVYADNKKRGYAIKHSPLHLLFGFYKGWIALGF